MDEKICQAYENIAHNYSPGDELFFFGFSRGAFMVRSLAGFICELGILKPTSLDHLSRIYEIYRKKRANIAFGDDPNAVQFLNNESPKFHEKKPVIRVVGVWDTVGSLGIPDIHCFNFSGFRKKHEFHNTSLHPRKLLRPLYVIYD